MSFTCSHSQTNFVTMVRRNVFFARNRQMDRCEVAIQIDGLQREPWLVLHELATSVFRIGLPERIDFGE
jgi:hypothetical protein